MKSFFFRLFPQVQRPSLSGQYIEELWILQPQALIQKFKAKAEVSRKVTQKIDQGCNGKASLWQRNKADSVSDYSFHKHSID